MQHLRLETPERENKGQELNSDLENFISFSLIYRFIGLQHEITEICSINRKHRSN